MTEYIHFLTSDGVRFRRLGHRSTLLQVGNTLYLGVNCLDFALNPKVFIAFILLYYSVFLCIYVAFLYHHNYYHLYHSVFHLLIILGTKKKKIYKKDYTKNIDSQVCALRRKMTRFADCTMA
jgi:hypothetical protein